MVKKALSFKHLYVAFDFQPNGDEVWVVARDQIRAHRLFTETYPTARFVSIAGFCI